VHRRRAAITATRGGRPTTIHGRPRVAVTGSPVPFSDYLFDSSPFSPTVWGSSPLLLARKLSSFAGL